VALLPLLLLTRPSSNETYKYSGLYVSTLVFVIAVVELKLAVSLSAARVIVIGKPMHTIVTSKNATRIVPFTTVLDSTSLWDMVIALLLAYMVVRGTYKRVRADRRSDSRYMCYANRYDELRKILLEDAGKSSTTTATNIKMPEPTKA
jgi:hypothetical protein